MMKKMTSANRGDHPKMTLERANRLRLAAFTGEAPSRDLGNFLQATEQDRDSTIDTVRTALREDHSVIVGPASAGRLDLLADVAADLIMAGLELLILDRYDRPELHPVNVGPGGHCVSLDDIEHELRVLGRAAAEHTPDQDPANTVLVVDELAATLRILARRHAIAYEDHSGRPPAWTAFEQLVNHGATAGIHLLVGDDTEFWKEQLS